MIDLTDDLIFDIFYDSWKIPIGIFSSDGALNKLYADLDDHCCINGSEQNC